MSEYGARDETRAYQNDRENQVRDMASWPCNHLTLLEAAKIVHGDSDLLSKLERAEKIDRLKAELAIKAEELRQAQLAEAYEGVEEQEMTQADLDRLAEERTETRSYPQKLNPHDE